MLGNTLVLEHNLFLGTLIKQPKLEPFTHFRTADPAACIRLGSMGLDVRGAGTKRDSERVREVERERKRERQIEKILSICVTKRNLKYLFPFFLNILLYFVLLYYCFSVAVVIVVFLLLLLNLPSRRAERTREMFFPRQSHSKRHHILPLTWSQLGNRHRSNRINDEHY